jgi:hypothetical protein
LLKLFEHGAAEQGDEADEAWLTSEPRSLSPVFGGQLWSDRRR